MTARKAVPDIPSRLTAAMREADRAFESVGGSTRHFVHDCLMPALEAARLSVVDAYVPVHLESANRDVDSLARKLDAAERAVAALREAQDGKSTAIDGLVRQRDASEISFNAERALCAHLLAACRGMDKAARFVWGDDLALVPAQWRAELAAVREAIALAAPDAATLSASDLAVIAKATDK
jgi:hypothetical protein